MTHEIELNNDMFENIKHIDENGREYWSARELMEKLQYSKWQNFYKVIKNSITSCKNSYNDANEHFTEVSKPLIGGNGSIQNVLDYKLSRYACYLIAQNGDSRKKVIALAQTYFAVQTRKMELTEQEYSSLSEDRKRLFRRKQVRKGNYSLNRIAKKSGVKRLDKFHNAGYKGLYNGETADDIFKRKKLRYREDILDNMCSEELADNLFRIAQTEAKLKRENINKEEAANLIHYEIGKEVRNAIKNMGGTMPEDLPTPKKSLKELEKEELLKIKGGCNFNYSNCIKLFSVL